MARKLRMRIRRGTWRNAPRAGHAGRLAPGKGNSFAPGAFAVSDSISGKIEGTSPRTAVRAEKPRSDKQRKYHDHGGQTQGQHQYENELKSVIVANREPPPHELLQGPRSPEHAHQDGSDADPKDHKLKPSDCPVTFLELRLRFHIACAANAKVSDGWPSSNHRIAKQHGGRAIRSTES
jgi:hypothetical protein